MAQGGAGTGGAVIGSNAGPHMEVAKPAIFNGEAGKVGGFIMACRLFIRMKLRGMTVEEQVQWVFVCAGRVGRCVEGGRNGGVRVRRDRI